MNKRRRSGCLPTLILLVVALTAGAAFAVRVMRPRIDRRQTISSSTLAQQIQAAQELVTTDYKYQSVGELKDQKEYNGIPLPFTERSVTFTFRGTIKAGVDVSEITPQVNDADKTVTLQIPPAKIISHEMPPGDVEPFGEQTGLFAKFTMDDYAALLENRRVEIEQQYKAEGHLEEAQKEAGRALYTLLSDTATAAGYEVKIEYKG